MASAYVNIKKTVLNTSPVLNAIVKQISCYNKTDGSVDLSPTGGIGSLTYEWSNSLQQSWHETAQDIYNLKEADYSVVVNSFAGCNTTKTFTIIQPDKLLAPTGINGPSLVRKNQSGLIFSVLSPDPSCTYVWSVPNGASINAGKGTTSITVTWGQVSGNVTVKAKNSCEVSPAFLKAITVKNVLAATANSLEPDPEENGFTQPVIMPNPAKNIADLQFHAQKGFVYTVQIADIAGKILLLKKAATVKGINIEMLNVQQLATGNYFVTLINNKGEKQTLRLVKE